MSKHCLTPAVLGIILAVVASTAPAGEKKILVRGEYFYNFEYAYITPVGMNEQWCTKGDMSRAELPEGWGTATVEVEGSLGPEGKYGNLGGCKRILTVKRVLTVTNLRGQQ